jgi:hypothetical protein
VSEQSGRAAERPRRRAERLLGAPATPPPDKPARERPEVPAALRWAAVAVWVEALALAALAAWLLLLTLTGSYVSLRNAVGEVVFVVLGGAALWFTGRGLWRLSSWSRGPVVVLQIFLGLLGYQSAFTYGWPVIGVPVLVLVAVVLYLLATPAARLAFLDRHG